MLNIMIDEDDLGPQSTSIVYAESHSARRHGFAMPVEESEEDKKAKKKNIDYSKTRTMTSTLTSTISEKIETVPIVPITTPSKIFFMSNFIFPHFKFSYSQSRMD